MGRSIVKNPETGNYQVYSSIVDAFILEEELDLEQLMEFWRFEYGRSEVDSFKRTIELIEKDPSGNRYAHYKMWHDHSMGHSHGSQAPEGSPFKPESCSICKDIKHDEEEYEKEKKRVP